MSKISQWLSGCLSAFHKDFLLWNLKKQESQEDAEFSSYERLLLLSEILKKTKKKRKTVYALADRRINFHYDEADHLVNEIRGVKQAVKKGEYYVIKNTYRYKEILLPTWLHAGEGKLNMTNETIRRAIIELGDALRDNPSYNNDSQNRQLRRIARDATAWLLFYVYD